MRSTRFIHASTNLVISLLSSYPKSVGPWPDCEWKWKHRACHKLSVYYTHAQKFQASRKRVYQYSVTNANYCWKIHQFLPQSSVVIIELLLDYLIKAVSAVANDFLTDGCLTKLNEIKTKIKGRTGLKCTSRRVAPTIFQTQESVPQSLVASMTRKRFDKIQDLGSIKGQIKSPCGVRGRPGHWYRKNHDCKEKYWARISLVDKVIKCKDANLSKVIWKNCFTKPNNAS